MVQNNMAAYFRTDGGVGVGVAQRTRWDDGVCKTNVSRKALNECIYW